MGFLLRLWRLLTSAAQPPTMSSKPMTLSGMMAFEPMEASSPANIRTKLPAADAPDSPPPVDGPFSGGAVPPPWRLSVTVNVADPDPEGPLRTTVCSPGERFCTENVKLTSQELSAFFVPRSTGLENTVPVTVSPEPKPLPVAVMLSSDIEALRLTVIPPAP